MNIAQVIHVEQSVTSIIFAIFLPWTVYFYKKYLIFRVNLRGLPGCVERFPDVFPFPAPLQRDGLFYITPEFRFCVRGLTIRHMNGATLLLSGMEQGAPFDF